MERTREEVTAELLKESNKRVDLELKLKDAEKDKEELKNQLNIRDKKIKEQTAEINSYEQQVETLEQR